VRLLAVELQGLPLMPASASHQINGIQENPHHPRHEEDPHLRRQWLQT
jgi:hypothetical protein